VAGRRPGPASVRVRERPVRRRAAPRHRHCSGCGGGGPRSGAGHRDIRRQRAYQRADIDDRDPRRVRGHADAPRRTHRCAGRLPCRRRPSRDRRSYGCRRAPSTLRSPRDPRRRGRARLRRSARPPAAPRGGGADTHTRTCTYACSRVRPWLYPRPGVPWVVGFGAGHDRAAARSLRTSPGGGCGPGVGP